MTGAAHLQEGNEGEEEVALCIEDLSLQLHWKGGREGGREGRKGRGEERYIPLQCNYMGLITGATPLQLYTYPVY